MRERGGGFRERKSEPKKTALTLFHIHSHFEKLILSYSHSALSQTLHFFSSPLLSQALGLHISKLIWVFLHIFSQSPKIPKIYWWVLFL